MFSNYFHFKTEEIEDQKDQVAYLKTKAVSSREDQIDSVCIFQKPVLLSVALCQRLIKSMNMCTCVFEIMGCHNMSFCLFLLMGETKVWMI